MHPASDGELAMERTLDRIQQPHRPGVDLLVAFELLVRESCGPAEQASGRGSRHVSFLLFKLRFNRKPPPLRIVFGGELCRAFWEQAPEEM